MTIPWHQANVGTRSISTVILRLLHTSIWTAFKMNNVICRIWRWIPMNILCPIWKYNVNHTLETADRFWCKMSRVTRGFSGQCTAFGAGCFELGPFRVFVLVAWGWLLQFVYQFESIDPLDSSSAYVYIYTYYLYTHTVSLSLSFIHPHVIVYAYMYVYIHTYSRKKEFLGKARMIYELQGSSNSPCEFIGAFFFYATWAMRFRPPA